jgi:hypothetical protein
METLSTKTSEKRSLAWRIFTLALCGALAIGNVSCGHKTEKDILEQENKIENINFQISHYISARKWFVEKYNKLLKYPKNESNKIRINESLSQLYDAITNYDEKLEDLAEDRIDAEKDLNEYISDLGSWNLPNKPLDPNRWDFLLTIK